MHLDVSIIYQNAHLCIKINNTQNIAY